MAISKTAARLVPVYMPAEMGGAEAFIKTYEETLAMVKEVEQLTINPADYAYEITKNR